LIDVPETWRVAAHARTTNAPTTPVITAPVMTSMRSYGRSAVVRRLSTAYDWMKLSPHGASVVPIVAATRSTPARSSGTVGTTRPRAAAPQSGPLRNPA
jgi:hypothetical protein